MKEKLVYTERLKQEREAKGFSYKDMAEQLNYKGKTTYMYIENGNTQPTLKKMRNISRILGKPVAYFFNLNIQEK